MAEALVVLPLIDKRCCIEPKQPEVRTWDNHWRPLYEAVWRRMNENNRRR